MNNDFQHLQAAHCENGVTTNLLRAAGAKQLTEPLSFGIGSGLFYVQLPFLKINNGPAIAFRTIPDDLSKYSYLYGPTYIKSINHWFLFYVNLPKSQVNILDPFGEENSYIWKYIFNNWW